jgi:hypothetical protein
VEWHFPYFNDEMGAAFGYGLATCDAFLMGRVLYEEWVEYWPKYGAVARPASALWRARHADPSPAARPPRGLPTGVLNVAYAPTTS